ncbi:MAG: DUF2085 domain-containing protein, partial [Actinobacteria bacterium]|nr:DUF2085 domain-containing protein [Actinomycetota bacterium]
LFLMFRKKQSDLPPVYVMVVLAVFFLSTFVDGLGSYLGFYMTNNIVRFSTGFLCGASIMTVLYPVFNFQYYRDPLKEKIFKRPFTFIIFVLSLMAFIVLTLFQFDFLGSFYYYLSSLSVVFTFFFVSLVMIYLIPFFSQKADRFFRKYLIIPIVLAMVLTALEIFISYKLHELMNNFV